MVPRPLHRFAPALQWVPALTWAALACTRGRWWATDQGLPTQRGESGADWPDVAVVVPAHNEEELLGTTLRALLAQDYPGDARIFAVDDTSTDRTAAVAADVQASLPESERERLQVVHGARRPRGWAGKPWAMHQAFERALATGPGWSPRYVLFTDADITHEASSLRQLVRAAMDQDLAAVSLMAKLSCRSRSEKLVVPAFVYFFAQLYPFRRVNDPRRSTAAAAGGCLLVEVAALVGVGGLRAIQDRTIDDVSLAKAVKATGAPIWLGLAGGPGAPQVESTRYYPRLGNLWDMVARNAYTQLRHSPVALAGTLAGLIATYVAPPALVATGAGRRRPSTVAAGALAWSAMAATYAPTVRYYDRPRREAWALPLTAALYAAMTAASAARHYRRRAGG